MVVDIRDMKPREATSIKPLGYPTNPHLHLQLHPTQHHLNTILTWHNNILTALSPTMACDCCGPPAQPPASTLTQSDKASSQCSDNCCDGTEQVSIKDEHDQKPDDSSSADKTTHAAESDDNAVPDCCRGKRAPCCDVSCLDRLALRECEGGDAAAQGENTPCSKSPSFASCLTE